MTRWVMNRKVEELLRRTNYYLSIYYNMPPKNNKRKYVKKSKDKKQDGRLKKLENFIYKTIENKQVNTSNFGLAIPSTGVRDGQFLSVAQGTSDGVLSGDPARIGNTITLMNQRFNFTFHQNPTGIIDDWNRIRVLIVEATDGNQALLINDVLQYHNYSIHGELIFSSPYTTKTTTNRRYKPLMDKTFELNYRATGATKVIKHVEKYKGGKLVEFDGNISATPTNHQISVFFLSDSGSLPHPSVSYSTRSTYKDA